MGFKDLDAWKKQESKMWLLQRLWYVGNLTVDILIYDFFKGNLWIELTVKEGKYVVAIYIPNYSKILTNTCRGHYYLNNILYWNSLVDFLFCKFSLLCNMLYIVLSNARLSRCGTMSVASGIYVMCIFYAPA